MWHHVLDGPMITAPSTQLRSGIGRQSPPTHETVCSSVHACLQRELFSCRREVAMPPLTEAETLSVVTSRPAPRRADPVN
jgi:hypothetical protein